MASKGSPKIFTHLWYANEAEEAAKFYASIFPYSRVDRVTPLLSETPSGPPGSVKVVDFTLFGQRFQAITAGPHDRFNDAISLVVLCDSQTELDRYWTALLEGGGKPPGVRLAHRSVRPQMADRPSRIGQDDPGQGRGSIEAGQRCLSQDGQARHRRAGACGRRAVSRCRRGAGGLVPAARVSRRPRGSPLESAAVGRIGKYCSTSGLEFGHLRPSSPSSNERSWSATIRPLPSCAPAFTNFTRPSRPTTHVVGKAGTWSGLHTCPWRSRTTGIV